MRRCIRTCRLVSIRFCRSTADVRLVFPWGHAAVGYLLYAVLCRYRTDDRPAGGPVLALALGTQFPDLVDKPLAWYLGVLPSGRSLGHSLFTALVLLAILDWVTTRYDRRELNVAFATGYLAHLAGDLAYPLLRGEYDWFRMLLWPAIPQPDIDDTGYTILEVLWEGIFTPTGVFELLLFCAVTMLWVSHRAPGLWLCLRAVRSLSRRVTSSAP